MRIKLVSVARKSNGKNGKRAGIGNVGARNNEIRFQVVPVKWIKIPLIDGQMDFPELQSLCVNIEEVRRLELVQGLDAGCLR